ncbi:TIGR02281 family clan AA aspartic protease [Ramlibacter solisilvae]|uniref:Peptidase A2 n=1 Tax=Ramlibacter tataouinensis TaxID=94132 RepID=A0A127JVI6_9BURK|nr:TIGR02281 family clan AA aspartic protease [Ramlibacter tataouinensis]AMO24026.1 peptidase A2 [Ramlibacter tataouinensis]
MPPLARRSTAAALLALACAASQAQVSLQGVLGNKALLIVNGSSPKAVSTGESFQGVKLVSVSGDQAVVEIEGSRRQLRVGDSPVRVGAGMAAAPASGGVIVLHASDGGHFMTEGRINGEAVRFMVDTGATLVALSETLARRIGLDYKRGAVGYASTANGAVPTWHLKLESVRVGDIELRDVEASVVPANMPFVLLGNSFLNRFRMKRDNDLMVLERRY